MPGSACWSSDPVAGRLVHGALEVMDGLHHVFEDGIEEFTRLLWVALGQQLHRTFEIGEEHRHLLAFAFERSPGVQDISARYWG